MQRAQPEQIPPGEHVHVQGAGVGLPFAIAAVVVGGAGAWRIFEALKLMVSGVVDCEGSTGMSLGLLRTGLIAGLVGGGLAILLSEVASRRHLGRARLVAVVGSVLGIFTALGALALLGITLLPEFGDCLAKGAGS